MKNILLYALLTALLACPFLSPVPAAADEFNITAKAAVVMDVATGRVIISKNMDMRLPPASTTKVMTALLALERTRLTDSIRVSRRASDMSPSKINLRPGDEISVEALLYSVLLKSANDAAAALAEGVGGSEDNFARMMTEKARSIGAVNTNFKNASGLPTDNHYSTAYDLALILRYAMQDPHFVEISSTKFATLNLGPKQKMLLKNHNKLLWIYDGAGVGKTGYTVAARHCYVGEANCENTRLIVAILKSSNPWGDVRAMLDMGFQVASSGRTLELDDNTPNVVTASAAAPHKKAVRARHSRSKKVRARKHMRARHGSSVLKGKQVACAK